MCLPFYTFVARFLQHIYDVVLLACADYPTSSSVVTVVILHNMFCNAAAGLSGGALIYPCQVLLVASQSIADEQKDGHYPAALYIELTDVSGD